MNSYLENNNRTNTTFTIHPNQNLLYASAEHRDDEEIVLKAAKDDSFAIKYASKRLRTSKEFISKLIDMGIDIFD